jgi:hypothetical protein
MVWNVAGVANQVTSFEGREEMSDAVSGKRVELNVVMGLRTGEAREKPEDVRLAACPIVECIWLFMEAGKGRGSGIMEERMPMFM